MERILNSPEILQKLQKGFGQLSTALRTFSKVCGLLMVQSEPTVPISSQPKSKSDPENFSASEGTCVCCGYTTDHRSTWNKHIASQKHKLRLQLAKKDQQASSDSDETESSSSSEPPPLQWDKELQNWMFSKESRWGPDHALNVAHFCVGKRYRSDHLKNFWRFEGECLGIEPAPLSITKPENWRKTSMTTITTLHSTYIDEMENAKEYLIYCKNKENELWKSVRGSRQRRIHNVIKAKPVSLKTFIKLMKENHCEMPPLRGRKKG